MTRTAAPTGSTNVFPGLRPFHHDEECLFFGRESQVDSMVDLLARSRFLAVVGTSGSGKSSLVNCGLRPALCRGLMAQAGTSWRIAQCRPGSSPMRAMIHALACDGVLYRDYQGGIPLHEVLDTSLRISKRGLLDVFRKARLPQETNLLIVIDQFEELFRYQTQSVLADADSGEEAIAFINLLLEARRETNLPVYIVITMRSDFLGNCAEFPGLPEAINEGQYLVPRMTREERRAAIKGPIAVGGARVSPVLLSRLVNDVGDNPDQLSILQHALNRTWAYWRNEGHGEGPISLEHYEAIGTMTFALDRHAEKAYAELCSDHQRTICERVFKVLTDKGTDVRGIRRPATMHTLSLVADATVAEVTDVINVFRKPSRSFLMPPLPESLDSSSVIDISHESLMRVWERLRLWVDEEAQSAQLYRRLSESAALHAEGKAALWRDPELQLAVEWRNRTGPTATWSQFYGGAFEQAMMFLALSEALQQSEVQQQEEHVQRKADYEKAVALAEEQNLRIALQIKATRRLRLLLTLVVILFGAAVFAGIRAVQQQHKAEELQRVSKARELAALATSTLKEDPERSVLLGMQAIDATLHFGQSPVPAAVDALQTAMLSLPENIKLNHSSAVLSIAYSSDGKNVVTGSADNVARVWDVRDGSLILDFKEHTGPVTGVAFSPNGKAVASISQDGTLRVWDATSGEGLKMFNLQLGHLTAIAYSPDGTSVCVGSSNKAATLWNISDGKELLNLRGHSGSITSVAFSPDGKFLSTASSDRTAIVWDRRTGELVSKIRGHSGPVNDVAFSPKGRLLATAESDNTARLWDFHKAVQVRNLRQSGAVKRVAFSPDGRWLATATPDTASVWDAAKGVQVLSVRPLGSVNSIAFDPGGEHLATATSNSVAQLWHLRGGKGLLSIHHPDSVNDLSFSPDGTKLATASSDNTAKVWDSSTGAELQSLKSSNPVNSVAFSKDGKHLAIASADGTATVWDIQSAKCLFTLKGHEASVNGTAYGPDDKTLATASSDGTARVWDATKEGPPLLVLRHSGPVNFVVYSPDGKRIATASSDGTVKVWDSSSGQSLLILKPGGGVLDVAYSRDGKRLATAGMDGDVLIWNAFTGELIKPTLHGHSSSVLAVVCSPDNRYLATASQDGTAKIWDMAENHLVETLSSQSGPVNSVAYSPDGKRIATANTDGTVQFYALDTFELLKLARSRTSRNLTPEECSHYLQTSSCPHMP